MATTKRRKTAKRRTTSKRAGLPKNAANAMQEVWLAGLGALAMAQRQGRSQFDALVKQGLEIESQLRKLAAPQFERAAKTMAAAAEAMSGRAQSTWREMQKVMAGQVDRVTSGLGKLGTPDVDALIKRVEGTMSHVQSIANWPVPMPWAAKVAPKARRKAKRRATAKAAPAKRRAVKRKAAHG